MDARLALFAAFTAGVAAVDQRRCQIEDCALLEKPTNSSMLLQHTHASGEPFHVTSCDMSQGAWEKNKVDTNTLYEIDNTNWKCTSKPNLAYEWNWKPDGCTLPVIEQTLVQSFFERKRLVLLGDSLVDQTFTSLTALMQLANVDASDKVSYIREDYLLLRTNCHTVKNSAEIGHKQETLCDVYANESDFKNVLDDLTVSTEDVVLLIGGYHHFAHPGNVYKLGETILQDVGHRINVEALTYGMNALFSWLDETGFRGSVVLQTYSPSHFLNGDFDEDGGCLVTQPSAYESFSANLSSPPRDNVESVNHILEGLLVSTTRTFQVRILDITSMSWLRPDAHPGDGDCAHWCLPGVPDNWNRALLQMLQED